MASVAIPPSTIPTVPMRKRTAWITALVKGEVGSPKQTAQAIKTVFIRLIKDKELEREKSRPSPQSASKGLRIRCGW